MMVDDCLVATDFSEASLAALQVAIDTVAPRGSIYLLHVIDTDAVEQIAANGVDTAASMVARLRAEAEARMQAIRQRVGAQARVETMVAVGPPFRVITELARDLDLDLVVLSTQGSHNGQIGELLFGSTAEKVLRASVIPVLCIPAGTRKLHPQTTVKQ